MAILNKKISEEQALELLKIGSFKKLPADKIKDFSMLLTKMDTEVAKSALSQIPQFTKFASEIVTTFKEAEDGLRKDNAENIKDFNESCDLVIEYLNKLANKRWISFKNKKMIIEEMIKILEIKGRKDTENKEWLAKMSSSMKSIVGAVAAIVGGIIGIGVLGVKFIFNRK